MTMFYFSTSVSDKRELHVAGVAGDLSGVEAAGSLRELVHLGEHSPLKKQTIASVCGCCFCRVVPAVDLPLLTPWLMQGA